MGNEYKNSFFIRGEEDDVTILERKSKTKAEENGLSQDFFKKFHKRTQGEIQRKEETYMREIMPHIIK